MKPYYDEDGVVIYHGDCREVLPSVAAGSVGMVLCDLPYGITANKWDSVIPLPELWAEYRRTTRDGAALAFTASQPFTSALVQSNLEWFRHEWIWIKNRGSNFANTVREPFKEHESVVVFSAGKWEYFPVSQRREPAGYARVKYKFNGDVNSENYRKFDRKQTLTQPPERGPSSWQKFNTDVGLHPTQKPVGLMAYMIRTYAKEADTVLDNCIGSGTTLVAAKSLGRRAIGIEIEERYCEIAAKRLSQRVLQFEEAL